MRTCPVCISQVDEDTARARATEIERLLRTGAQVLAAPDHDERVAAFNDSSIEDILARYAETRTISGPLPVEVVRAGAAEPKRVAARAGGLEAFAR